MPPAGALTYQWQVSQNGGVTFTNISATATNASYVTVPTTLADNTNRYRVVVSGACPPPATSSPPAVLTVDPALGLPAITTHPQSCRTQPGVAVSLTAYSTNATGYQWRFNGVDIPGATGMTLQIANPQPTNSGYYLAIATNATGWVPSQKAYLAVVGDQGIVPFSNVGFAQVLSQLNYPGPLNGVAQLVAGPELDQMQPLLQDPWLGPGPTPPWWPSEPITATITDGYYDFGDVVSVPTVSPGQTVYYRVDVTDTNYPSLPPRPSRVLTLVAGGGSYPTPSVSTIQFPAYIEWPDPSPYTGAVTNQFLASAGRDASGFLLCDYDFGYPHFQWRKDGVPIPGATNYLAGPARGRGLYYLPFLTITNLKLRTRQTTTW